MLTHEINTKLPIMLAMMGDFTILLYTVTYNHDMYILEAMKQDKYKLPKDTS